MNIFTFNAHIYELILVELDQNLVALILVSSEGALYVIMPYDYPMQRSTHFLNTHRSLITTLSIDAMMTLLTV